MKEYIFTSYDKRYPAQFAREKRKLKKILPYAVTVEHFGSTAVPGLKGKGVIDVYVLIPNKKIETTKTKLNEHGYMYHGIKDLEGGIKMVLRKKYVYKKKLRMVNLHVGTVGIQDFTTCLAFRDQLRGSSALCREYEQVKKVAISKLSNGGEYSPENTRMYVEAKSSFVTKQNNKHISK
jgi:GrpB-like predicted nucleotidyltransferase (UPF0157 family)